MIGLHPLIVHARAEGSEIQAWHSVTPGRGTGASRTCTPRASQGCFISFHRSKGVGAVGRGRFLWVWLDENSILNCFVPLHSTIS